MRNDGRRALWLIVGLLGVVLARPLKAQSETAPETPSEWNGRLEVGPIEGLTTDWHPAPRRAAIPLGTRLRFRLFRPFASAVTWSGARDVSAFGVALAEREFDVPGVFTVSVDFEGYSGPERESCELEVLESVPAPLVLDGIEASVDSLVIDQADPNSATMAYFFRDESVAALRHLGPRHDRTSINRWVRLAADTGEHPLATWLEWKLDGRPQRHLGQQVRMRVFVTGARSISAGPPEGAAALRLDTYHVRIVAPSVASPWLDGLPVSFQAETEPPGLESEITWLAATEHGSASPVLGEGPEFLARFDETAAEGDGQSFRPSRSVGVRADDARLGFCSGSELLAGPGLFIDPDWGFDPGSEFPPGPPVGPAIELPGCRRAVDGVIGDVDANNDGILDMVGLEPTVLGPGECTDGLDFCVERDGFFSRVDSPPFFRDTPIPLAAMAGGCAGVPPQPACPLLSGGDPAVECGGFPADSACTTITLCPDRGAWADPTDPSVENVFVARDIRETPPGLAAVEEEPPPLGEFVPVNPCEWSQQARRELPSIGLDTGTEPNPYAVHKRYGSDQFNVSLDGGLSSFHVGGQGIFYPSVSYEISNQSEMALGATVFGHGINVLGVKGQSFASQCRYDVSYEATSDLGFLDLPGQWRLQVGDNYIDVDLDSIDEQSDAAAAAACEAAYDVLVDAERQANEELHDALAAWALYNLAGPGQSAVTRDEAQGYIDSYEAAVAEYVAARAAFEAAQRPAIRRGIDARVGDLDIQFALTDPLKLGTNLGPFTCSLEANVVGKVGLGADVLNQWEESASPEGCKLACRQDSDCAPGRCDLAEHVCEGARPDGTTCSRVSLGQRFVPRAAVGLYVFLARGIDAGGYAGVKGGVKGSLDLAKLQLPLTGELSLARAARPAPPPGLPPPYDMLPGFREPLVTPSVATFTTPYEVGARLKANFLSGRIDLVVKAWALFVAAEWKKTLVSWNGIERTWEFAPFQGDDPLAMAFAAEPLLGLSPDMVSLPRLSLVDPPLGLPRERVEDQLDQLLGRGHREDQLGKPWGCAGGTAESGRCCVEPGGEP